MKPATLIKLIVTGLQTRGYLPLTPNKGEAARLRNATSKITFIILKCGQVLSVQNKVTTVICSK